MNLFADFKAEKIAYHTTPKSLQLYIHQKGFLRDTDFVELKESLGKKKYIEAIGYELKVLAGKEAAILRDFCIVHVLAKKRTFLGLMQELNLVELPYATSLNDLTSSYDRVFWLLSVNRECVENCYYANNAKQLSNRYWLTRNDVIPAAASPLTPENIEKLKVAILDYLPTEIRGRTMCSPLFPLWW